MKNYEAFRVEMSRRLAEKAEREGYCMTERKVCKVNRELDGICIAKTPEQKCQATLYLQDMYQDYMQEMQDDDHDEAYMLELVAETGWSMLTKNPEIEGKVQSIVIGKEHCLDKVICQLVNPERNQGLLANVPHRQFLDLAVIYRMKLGDGLEAILTNDLAERIGADEEKLYQAAMKNWKPAETVIMPRESMAFLTTADKMYGAGLMMETAQLRQYADRIEGDVYIIPSSIHEVILMPAMAWDPKSLKETIREANRTFISPEIFLSDTLYYYDRARNEVRIA